MDPQYAAQLLLVGCPYCHARRGERCISRYGNRLPYGLEHKKRRLAYRRRALELAGLRPGWTS